MKPGSGFPGALFSTSRASVYRQNAVHFCLGEIAIPSRKSFFENFANFVPGKPYYIVKEALTVAKQLVTKQRRKVRQRAILISGVGGNIRFAVKAARSWLKVLLC